jgi:hypothetical protein
MTFLTGAGMLDDALSIIQDNSTTMRTKMLRFANVVAQKLAVVRPWLWLNTSVTLVPVNNVITKPANYGAFSYLLFGMSKAFDERNRLDPREAFNADNTQGMAYPHGFTEDATTITLHGAGWTDSVTLGYTIEPPAIIDSADSTIWPVKCRPVFMKSILDWYYEYDLDERKTANVQLNMAEISDLKKWDNQQKPKTQNSRHGYHRTR